jgi:iron complex transport system substrate-binding protein
MSCARLRLAARKPRVSAFTSANIDKIVALGPDLVLTFSDLQADIAADLVRCGLPFVQPTERRGNPRYGPMLGTMVDADARADELVATLEAGLVQARSRAECLPKRPEGILRGMGEARAPNAVGW